jgi:hypothetical protein
MALALEEQRDTPNTHALAFEERLALLVDRERLSRQNCRYRGLLREARLKMAQSWGADQIFQELFDELVTSKVAEFTPCCALVKTPPAYWDEAKEQENGLR